LEINRRRDIAARFSRWRSGAEPTFSAGTGPGSIQFTCFWLAICAFVLVAERERRGRVTIDTAAEVIRVRRWFRTVEVPLTDAVRVKRDDTGEDSSLVIVSSTRRAVVAREALPEDARMLEKLIAASLPVTR